jgi:hypothetical protein
MHGIDPWVLVAVTLLRTAADYAIGWNFYFPLKRAESDGSGA